MTIQIQNIQYCPPVAEHWIVNITEDSWRKFASEEEAKKFAADFNSSGVGMSVAEYYGSHPEYGNEDREFFYKGHGSFVPAPAPSWAGYAHDVIAAWVRAFPAGTMFSEDGQNWYDADGFIKEVV